MSMMCAMGACKAKPGACGHEKMMMLVMVAAVAAGAFLLFKHFA